MSRIALTAAALAALLTVEVSLARAQGSTPQQATGATQTQSGQSGATGPSGQATRAPAPGDECHPSGLKHCVTVSFTYDFAPMHACSAKVKRNCIDQFNVYDVSGGADKRIKLFSIPAPAGAATVVKDITGRSPLLTFEPGKHELAVTAQIIGGKESATLAATVWIVVPPVATTTTAPPATKN